MNKKTTENELLLYKKVENELKRMLQCGILKKGGKLPGERALSEQLNVARGTLRNALSQLEKNDFLIRIPGKGNFLRDTAITTRDLRIGYLFPKPNNTIENQSYGNYIINSEVWNGILEYSAQFGIAVSFIPVELSNLDNNNELIERIKKDCSAVILPSWEFTSFANLLKENNIPFIFTCFQKEYPFVYYNVDKAISQCADFILSKGCKTVTLLGLDYGIDYDLALTFERKKQIFKEKFAAANYPIPDENIVTIDTKEPDIIPNFKNFFSQNKNRTDAYLGVTPIVSIALLHIANHDHWNIPNDIQIIGYGNNNKTNLTFPKLTHMFLPHLEMGKKAVEYLVKFIIDNEEIPKETFLDAQLIIGETTK